MASFLNQRNGDRLVVQLLENSYLSKQLMCFFRRFMLLSVGSRKLTFVAIIFSSVEEALMRSYLVEMDLFMQRLLGNSKLTKDELRLQRLVWMVDINLSAICEIVAIILSSLAYIMLEPLKLAFDLGYESHQLAGAVFVQLLLELGLEMLVDLSAMWAETAHKIPVLEYFEWSGSVTLVLMLAFDACMALLVALWGFTRYPTFLTCESSFVCACLDQPALALYNESCTEIEDARVLNTTKVKLFNATMPSQDMFSDINVSHILAALFTSLLVLATIVTLKWGKKYMKSLQKIHTMAHTLHTIRGTFRSKLQELVNHEMEVMQSEENLKLLKPYSVPRLHIQMKRKIGKGAYGEVWKAACNGFQVAAKKLWLDEGNETEDVLQFREECNLMAKLQSGGVSHKNLVQMLFVCWESELLLLLEFHELGDVAAILHAARDGDRAALQRDFSWRYSEDGATPPPLLNVAIGVTYGMEYCNRRNIIHRDLKPGNILVQGNREQSVDEWNAKIADFGASRVMNTDSGEMEMTQIGTPYYVAPEVMSEGIYDHRADIFSFGVVLLDMAAYLKGGVRSLWREPFSIPNVILGKRPQIPEDDVPKWLENIITSCWHADPDMRPETFAHVRRLLMKAIPVADE